MEDDTKNQSHSHSLRRLYFVVPHHCKESFIHSFAIRVPSFLEKLQCAIDFGLHSFAIFPFAIFFISLSFSRASEMAMDHIDEFSVAVCCNSLWAKTVRKVFPFTFVVSFAQAQE